MAHFLKKNNESTNFSAPNSTNNLCEASEAYQFLVKKRFRQPDERQSRVVSDRWHLASKKTSKALGVIGTLAATHEAKQRQLAQEMQVWKSIEQNINANIYCVVPFSAGTTMLCYFVTKDKGQADLLIT